MLEHLIKILRSLAGYAESPIIQNTARDILKEIAPEPVVTVVTDIAVAADEVAEDVGIVPQDTETAPATEPVPEPVPAPAPEPVAPVEPAPAAPVAPVEPAPVPAPPAEEGPSPLERIALLESQVSSIADGIHTLLAQSAKASPSDATATVS